MGRWISRSDEGVTSGLRFVAYHLLQAKRKKEALSVLLDLQYVEVCVLASCGMEIPSDPPLSLCLLLCGSAWRRLATCMS